MSLLIALGVIGGLAVLLALYLLFLELSVYVVAYTQMFKERIEAVKQKRKDKKLAKKHEKEKIEEIKKEAAIDEIKVEINDAVEEIK